MLHKDPFTCWLEDKVQLTVYQPAGFLGGPPIGWRLRVGSSTFVYRVPPEDPHTLLIVLFERAENRTGLRSPFMDFVRFLNLIRRSGVPIHSIKGHVDALSDRPEDSLASERIGAFYKRYLAAGPVGLINGLEWVAGDLRTYVPPLRAQRAAEDNAQR